MTIALREALADVDDAVAAKLAENDIVSIEDAAELTAADLDSLGFTLGVRNKILRAVAGAKPMLGSSTAAALTGSVKNLLSKLPSALSGGGSSTPAELATFQSVLKPFESKEDAKSIEARKKLWRAWDTNGNDMLSLAEADKGVKVLLISETKDKVKGERIWRRFRKSYIRAFLDAADASPQRKKGAKVSLPNGKRRMVCDDDYVTQKEFRLLLCYLSIYATMYELFALIDGGSEGFTAEDDARISRSEWDAAVPAVQAASTSWAPFVALQKLAPDGSDFAAIDANGGGFILLTELCEYIENGEKQAKTAVGALLGVGE